MNHKLEKTIHLTDLSFIRFCNETYGVNRGVYNTIDTWFYEQGLENIIERRKSVLSFLEFNTSKTDLESTRIRFGNGGLTLKLQEYFFATTDNGLLNWATSLKEA